MLHSAGGGHFGGSLSLVDVLLVLVRDHLRLDDVASRDRLVLSKGHGMAALYCVLVELGLMADDALDGFGHAPDALPSHPERGTHWLVEVSGGSLGQGLSVALGMALILRDCSRRAYAILGDGECQEGQVWEAAMLAHRLGVGNLTAIIDCNGRQECGYRSNGRAEPPVLAIAEKWRAFGWRVAEVDGHDSRALSAAFGATGAAGPYLVIAHTEKGHGFDAITADGDRFHCATLSEDEYRSVLA